MTDAPPPAPEAAPEAARPTITARWYSGRSLLALAVSVVALGFAAAPYVSPEIMGRNVRAYLLKHPEVLDEVVAARQSREEGARVQTTNAAVAANSALLRADPRDPAFGPENAKVTVIEFFDFRCPGCKAVAPDYVRLIQAHPDVRFVFKDWPILDRGDDAVSHYAARAAVAANQQGRYLEVYEGLMAEPALDEAAVDRVLVERGVDLARAKAAMASPEVAAHLADIQTTAMAFRLVGTPTFLVNGQATTGIAPQEVLQAIEAAKTR